MSSPVTLPPLMEYLPSGVWADLHHGRKPKTHPLDGIRMELWRAFRHLFPPHAVALQNDHGAILVSWSMADDPHATSAYAAPIMLRLEPELVELLEEADEAYRKRVAANQEQYLRCGLVGYDPYACANARVIILG
ncbi:MAG: hypothetical protein HY854_11500 [Burkholderiales bacterium]|nr:hypothetical protein [Burkholderiales bacterium]